MNFSYRIRIKLWTLMVAILIVGGPIGWMARLAHVQRESVAKVLRLHGMVKYDWDQNVAGTSGPAVPNWLRGIMGDDYFQRVVKVAVPKSPLISNSSQDSFKDANEIENMINEDQLNCLEGFGHLEVLDYRMSGKIAPIAVSRLGKLNHLRDLTLSSLDLKEVDVKFLKSLNNIENISIKIDKHEDGGVKFVEWLPSVKNLQILDLQLNDVGLSRIGKLSKIESLAIECVNVSDVGVSNLQGLKSLGSLTLRSASKISPDGIRHLSMLPKLWCLDLSGTPVTAAGLKHLDGLPNLRILSIQNKNIDKKYLDEFTRNNPKIRLTIYDQKSSGIFD